MDIIPIPEISLDFTYTIGLDGTVSFENKSTNATSYEWYFGDGSLFSTETAPKHKYLKSGTYQVILKGQTDTDSKVIIKDITLNIVPQLNLAFTYTIGLDGTVSFENKSTNATSYEWNFGDGSPINKELSPKYKYKTNGNYIVTLKGNNASESRTLTNTIALQLKAPIANFQYTTSSFLEPAELTFSNISLFNIKNDWFINGLPFQMAVDKKLVLNRGIHIIELKAEGFGSSSKKDTIYIFGPSNYNDYGFLEIQKNKIFYDKQSLKDQSFVPVIKYLNNRLENMNLKLPQKFLNFNYTVNIVFGKAGANIKPEAKYNSINTNILPPQKGAVVFENMLNSLYETGNFNQSEILIHEMAHAYHDQVLGFGFKPIVDTYNDAINSGRYQLVKHTKYPDGKAYATTNYIEYFAEITEAYFGTNDYFPFNREDLKNYDPNGYQLVESIFGK